MADWSEMDRVFATFFRESPPARATIEAELIYDCLVEMDCVAWKPG
jgi:enamine deaminase RidA (YjgF/YER057c/UK114 family)